ncbi:histidine kinase dimerization/phospho-acceptor domain-containing protein [Paraclostridium bifermentans]|nr:histidine kinase dimerization/phospho-acceptor domain-containing protein [Paraclostridium bifermentans]
MSNKNTLNKKISFIFISTVLIQFTFNYISIILFSFRSLDALIKAAHLTLPCLICYAYIYKKIEKKVDYIEYIDRNIKDIEKGDLEHELDVIGNDELSSIAQSENNISDRLDKALESQLKGERTKTELITNVSHDLKTPLTSIISYIDILKNNELDEQTTKTYIDILDKKAAKLKTLVEDIFRRLK